MATGGVSPVDKKFRLPSKIVVQVTKGDILQSKAPALATGEDVHLKGQGGVSKRLIETCSKVYTSCRDQLKKSKKSEFELGHVYPVRVPPNHSADKRKRSVHFEVVFHAIVPNVKVSKTQSEWRDTMKHMYYRLLRAVDKEGKRLLALPLLGSGGAGASLDEAMDILTEALATYRLRRGQQSPHLKKILLYIREQRDLDNMTSKLSRHHLIKEDRAGDARRKRETKPGKAATRSNACNGHSGFDDECSNLSVILGVMSMKENDTGEEAMDVDENDKSDEDEYDDDEEDEDASEKEEVKEEEDKCAICLDELTNPKKLDKCGHVFCTECIDDTFKHHKPACPTCNTVYGLIQGNQPRGTMRVSRDSFRLPGYKNCGMIIIDYVMPSGIQEKEHPKPGYPYHGTSRRAYIPDTEEGRKVCRLLRVAFDNRLIFTVGTSRTTGREDVVTWNDVHHKTNIEGGPTHFGYPDPLYLSRVQEELAAKGVTEECLKGRSFEV